MSDARIDTGDPKPRLLLIRHPQVDPRFRGVCYGRSDVALSSEGQRQSLQLARSLSHLPVQRIVFSGTQRTALLAIELGRLVGVTAEHNPALVERDFGRWELQTWDDIYKRDGDEMLKMVSDPEHFRPGGGETSHELADRVFQWYRSEPADGLTVAVTHGGPIAAVLGRQRQIPVSEWIGLIPGCGEMVWTEPQAALAGDRS